MNPLERNDPRGCRTAMQIVNAGRDSSRQSAHSNETGPAVMAIGQWNHSGGEKREGQQCPSKIDRLLTVALQLRSFTLKDIRIQREEQAKGFSLLALTVDSEYTNSIYLLFVCPRAAFLLHSSFGPSWSSFAFCDCWFLVPSLVPFCATVTRISFLVNLCAPAVGLEDQHLKLKRELFGEKRKGEKLEWGQSVSFSSRWRMGCGCVCICL